MNANAQKWSFHAIKHGVWYGSTQYCIHYTEGGLLVLTSHYSGVASARSAVMLFRPSAEGARQLGGSNFLILKALKRHLPHSESFS